MSYLNKHSITWDDFFKDTLDLCNKIKEKNLNFKGMVVITRGGLISAGIISSQLNIKKVETFAISSYDDTSFTQNQIEVLSWPKEAMENKGKGWIVVDELLDTGKTAKYVRLYLPKCFLVTTYTKNTNPELGLDLYSKYYEPTMWLCLPWSSYTY